MKLLTEYNVSVRKLPGVIETVLAKIVGCVPSPAFLSQLYAEAKDVASKQVATAMIAGLEPQDHLGNTLHQDAISKYHEHFEGMN